MSGCMFNVEEFLCEINAAGYCIFPDVVGQDLLSSLRRDIRRWTEVCAQIQTANGLEPMQGVAHHVVDCGHDSLMVFLEQLFLDEYITAYFEGPYILNSMGAFVNSVESSYKHAHGFHRDVRTFSGDLRLMLNMLVLIDDFTPENGGTKLVSGSHRLRNRPSDAFLERNSVQLRGSAGTIVLFDSNLWHSAAPNRTRGERIALTPTFTRPLMKQQMDYPRVLGEAAYLGNERMRQLLGYNSRVPASLNEWYQPEDRRMYKRGQG